MHLLICIKSRLSKPVYYITSQLADVRYLVLAKRRYLHSILHTHLESIVGNIW